MTSDQTLDAINSTIRNLIAPGGQMRLSPYAQNAITRTIWGVDRRDARAWNKVLQGPTIAQLAEVWVSHLTAGGESASGLYGHADDHLFHAVLIEHASRTIAQLQLALLDLRQETYDRNLLNVTLVGEAAGPFAVSLLDFLTAASDAHQLFETPLPLALARFYLTARGRERERTLKAT